MIAIIEILLNQDWKHSECDLPTVIGKLVQYVIKGLQGVHPLSRLANPTNLEE
jgi:hypothetical protein